LLLVEERLPEVPPPYPTKRVAPIYPPEAQAAGIQGQVLVEAVIGVNGKVTDAHVVQSIRLPDQTAIDAVKQLDEAALDAVKQWEYAPTLVNGAAVSVIMTVTVNFSLK
jgi:TonB family protein